MRAFQLSLRTAIAGMNVPLWKGETLADRTLLLWHEQGFGDSLQFIRYLPLVAQRALAEGGRIVLQPPPPLYRLFARSFGALAPVVKMVEPEDANVEFDLHCSLMSLPERMKTTLGNIPSDVPYLEADPLEVEHWRRRLSQYASKKVGVVWSGDSRKGEGRVT